MNIGISLDNIIKYFIILISLYAAGSIILRYFHIPAKIIITILSNSLIGLSLLILTNVFLTGFNARIPVNPFNLIFTAIFGFPGILFLIALKFIL